MNMRRNPGNMRPPVEIPSTVRPNIRPAVRPHSECWAQEYTPGVANFPRIGDVRRCEHGKIQVATETRSRTIAGPGTHWWRDLRPWLDRKEYKLAEAALRAGEDF